MAKKKAETGVKCPEQFRPLLVPIESIRPDPKNPRTGHDIDGIASSLRELGWHAAIVVDATGMVSVHHGCLEAAKQLGETLVPVLRIDEDREHAIARNVADNATAKASTWDLDYLVSAIEESPMLESLVEDFDLSGVLNDIYSAEAPNVASSNQRTKPAEKTKRSTLVSVVLHVEDVESIEKAIGLAQTGSRDRGAALVVVCKEYIENREKRQFQGHP